MSRLSPLHIARLGRLEARDALHRAWVAVGERLAGFNGKSGDELLDRDLFYTLLEVRCADEAVQAVLQPGQTAQLAGLPAAGA